MTAPLFLPVLMLVGCKNENGLAELSLDRVAVATGDFDYLEDILYRLEIAHDCPAEHMDYLLEMFELDRGDLYPVDGPVNLNRLMAVCQLASRGAGTGSPPNSRRTSSRS